jgi:hypothetical protein
VKPQLSVTLVTALTLLASMALAQETIGVVKRAKGHVAIERSGVQVPVIAGSELRRGDRLITGDNSYANLNMRRTAPLAVGPKNEVELDRYAAGAFPVVKRPAPPILQGLASFFAVNRQR